MRPTQTIARTATTLVAAFALTILATASWSEEPMASAQSAQPAASTETYEPMKPFLPYVGRTWRGSGKDEQGKDIIDVSHWELILGGRAVQTTHKIEGGSYGGRTIIFFDEGNKQYVYHYFTTGGFHTQGTMKIEGEKIISSEAVSGHATIVQVDGTSTIKDGKMTSVSEYILKDGSRKRGHSFAYEEAAGATVGF
jgi:hypothetical protein